MKIYIITMDILFGTTRGESDRTSKTQGGRGQPGKEGNRRESKQPVTVSKVVGVKITVLLPTRRELIDGVPKVMAPFTK